MRLDQARDKRRGDGAAGFTLVELLVVIAIIGLIISLVLVAAMDGVRRAEERATQALITKLETALLDRIDALLNSQAPVNQTHRYLASINYTPDGTTYVPVGATNSSQSDERRAQVIAQFDYIRAELPDIFFVNSLARDGGSITSSGTIANNYPINFAGTPYPPGNSNLYNYVVPLGVGYDTYGNAGGILEPITYGALASNNQTPVTGMFGASFAAAGGIYKNLYAAAAADLGSTTLNISLGYDGADNNGNGYIDEMGEVSLSSDFATAVKARLDRHTHKTARAEMLYATLVEGLGPLGSAFNRDDFTAREVQDTDGDGLPEFVDAWGEPLQFYRWPIYFGGASVPGSSDLQKGSDPYDLGYPETREVDPLDPNQLLVSPGWWSALGNPGLASPPVANFVPPNGAATGAYPPGQAAIAFMHYFHILVEPNVGAGAGLTWDRTGIYSRRAFFSKFLVLSAGPDKEPGVAGFGRDYSSSTTGGTTVSFPWPTPSSTNPSYTIEQMVQYLLHIENQASQSEPNVDSSVSNFVRTGSFFEVPNMASPTTAYLRTNVGLDDISNHNIQAPSTGVR